MAEVVTSVGKVAPIYRGKWSGTDSYAVLDIVVEGVDSFIAKVGNKGVSPREDENAWGLVSKGTSITNIPQEDIELAVKKVIESYKDLSVFHAQTADKLSRPFKINGVDTDGSSDITVQAIPSNNSELVHRKGKESIAGSKTFEDEIEGKITKQSIQTFDVNDAVQDLNDIAPLKALEVGSSSITYYVGNNTLNTPTSNKYILVKRYKVSEDVVEEEIVSVMRDELSGYTRVISDVTNSGNFGSWVAYARDTDVVHTKGDEDTTGHKKFEEITAKVSHGNWFVEDLPDKVSIFEHTARDNEGGLYYASAAQSNALLDSPFSGQAFIVDTIVHSQDKDKYAILNAYTCERNEQKTARIRVENSGVISVLSSWVMIPSRSEFDATKQKIKDWDTLVQDSLDSPLLRNKMYISEKSGILNIVYGGGLVGVNNGADLVLGNTSGLKTSNPCVTGRTAIINVSSGGDTGMAVVGSVRWRPDGTLSINLNQSTSEKISGHYYEFGLAVPSAKILDI